MSDAEEAQVQTHMQKLTSRYKASWKEFDLNQAFWEEVLVGRKIESLVWDAKGVSGLKLDSGEIIYLTGESGRFCIQDGV